jgi:hypothetical protein
LRSSRRGLLSVTRQPDHDGESHQQERFEDYSDHDLVDYTIEVGMIIARPRERRSLQLDSINVHLAIETLNH